MQSIAPSTPAYVFRPAGPEAAHLLASGNAYGAALAYLNERIDIQGDVIAALRDWVLRPAANWRSWLPTVVARLWRFWPESLYQSRARARSNIRFHYDYDPQFYRQFLGETMVYSCAYFERPDMTVDEAQSAKLDYICRKLDLQPGDRFLDVGCGFGALVMRAAQCFAARAAGCTLSRRQFETAARAVREHGIGQEASITLGDYRDLDGPFDKIASVGMVEHVGVHRLRGYFKKIYAMLAPGGLFLNHGITRPESVRPGPEWLFLRHKVFPGGELPQLSEVVRAAGRAGFEVLDVENLRVHYARTCRLWVERLLDRERACRALVGGTVHRTWVLYLAASALSFENGLTDVCQLLLAKRSSPQRRHWTRAYLYN
ncbi:MAG TPA: cyclopropane-fatty-acyl-phospholipid synthase family protein [Bryobacteraceae bacterium]|nr:cyclopropane-fatty-acyl-phospholipid synthase family protein [Bryobacteraceae bacterium]